MITLLLQNVMKSRPLKLVQYTSRNKNIQMGTDKRSANRSEPENKRFSSLKSGYDPRNLENTDGDNHLLRRDADKSSKNSKSPDRLN